MERFETRNKGFMQADFRVLADEKRSFTVALRKSKRSEQTSSARLSSSINYDDTSEANLIKLTKLCDEWDVKSNIISHSLHIKVISVLVCGNASASYCEVALKFFARLTKSSIPLEYGVLSSIISIVNWFLASNADIDELCFEIFANISTTSNDILWEFGIYRTLISNINQPKALKILNDLSWFDNILYEMLEESLLDVISPFLKFEPKIQAQVLLILSNVACSSCEAIEKLITHSIFTETLKFICSEAPMIRSECSFILWHLAECATEGQLKRVSKLVNMTELNNALITPHRNIQLNYLNFIKKLLENDEKIQIVTEVVEKLVYDSNLSISQLAKELVEIIN